MKPDPFTASGSSRSGVSGRTWRSDVGVTADGSLLPMVNISTTSAAAVHPSTAVKRMGVPPRAHDVQVTLLGEGIAPAGEQGKWACTWDGKAKRSTCLVLGPTDEGDARQPSEAELYLEIGSIAMGCDHHRRRANPVSVAEVSTSGGPAELDH
jgi:hypothetical protein